MTAAYGPYAASATGGNDLARDFLAGIAALYSSPSKQASLTLRILPRNVTLALVRTHGLAMLIKLFLSVFQHWRQAT